MKSVFKPEEGANGTLKSSTRVRHRTRKWTFSSFLALGFGPEAHAKATVLTMVDMDTGYPGVLMVSGKSPDNFMVAFFVEELRAEKTRLRLNLR